MVIVFGWVKDGVDGILSRFNVYFVFNAEQAVAAKAIGIRLLYVVLLRLIKS